MAAISSRAGLYKLVFFILVGAGAKPVTPRLLPSSGCAFITTPASLQVVLVYNASRAVHRMGAMSSGNDFASTISHVQIGNRAVYNACRGIDESDFSHVERGLRDEYIPPKLRVLQTWISRKPAPSSITLVTQLTFSRCETRTTTWPKP